MVESGIALSLVAIGAVLAPSARHITPCRPLESASISDLLPATGRPNATRKVCSSVAWYGSFKFSWYSFQLPGKLSR
jgi:hypothetical protein